mmetsp:Transcript_28723/g.44911  ORF Transcript_28723/g.44911 Transcript_28723/m.44911 type:complete len:80 (+) Transcript_28723:326-565(+)
MLDELSVVVASIIPGVGVRRTLVPCGSLAYVSVFKGCLQFFPLAFVQVSNSGRSTSDCLARFGGAAQSACWWNDPVRLG